MRLSQDGRYALTTMKDDAAACRNIVLLKFKLTASLTEDQAKLVDRFNQSWVHSNWLQRLGYWEQLHRLISEFGYDPGFRIPTELGKGGCYQIPKRGSLLRGVSRRELVLRQMRAKAKAFEDAIREFAPAVLAEAEQDLATAITEVDAREQQFELEQTPDQSNVVDDNHFREMRIAS